MVPVENHWKSVQVSVKLPPVRLFYIRRQQLLRIPVASILKEKKLHTIRTGFQSDECDVTESELRTALISVAPKFYATAIAAALMEKK